MARRFAPARVARTTALATTLGLALPGAAFAQQATAPGAAPAGAAPAAAAPAPAASSSALDVLLRQAAYWRDQNNPPRAEEAIRRALLLSPNNPRALSILAQVQANAGDATGASKTLQSLRQAQPSGSDLSSAEQAVKLGSISPDALNNARSLARAGKSAEAAQAYRQIFNGAQPPDALATEYYQTLSGSQGGYQQGVQGLAQAATQDPNNLRAQLAYAQALTYRQETREQGIARLAVLSRNPQIGDQARASWRQAVGWLPMDKSSIPTIKAYQAANPDDATAATVLANALNPPNQVPGSQDVQQGYEAYQSGQLDKAQQLFRHALTTNPQDAGATGGLGLVLLKQGRTAEATTLLNRAAALDPAHAANWRQALSGAALGNQFAAASSAARSGDLPRAEQAYRALLAKQPGNSGIKLALANVLSQEGNTAEAQQLLAEVAQTGNSAAAGQAQAQIYSQQAKAAPDIATRIALQTQAANADPSSPWLRLDLARSLYQNGQPDQARMQMAAVTDVSRPSADDVQAGLIFANETGDSAGAAALIDRLPARQRTPAMRAALAQAQVQGQIDQIIAMASTDPASARMQLLSLASHSDPTGGRGLAVAQAFSKLNDYADARTAIQTAAASTLAPSNAARIAWAQGLLAAKDPVGARAMLLPLQMASLTPDQAATLAGMQRGIAIVSSDTLNTAGRTADAYDQLAPALMKQPTDPALNAALARLYQSADDPQKALAINEQILAQDPTNADARRGAVAAAIQAGDYAQASRFVEDSITASPNDPQNWVLAADIAQARGLNNDALHDLRQARALRQQQLGFAGASLPAGTPFQVASNGAMPSPVSANPFRNQQTAVITDSGSAQPSGLLSGSGLVLGGGTTGSALAYASTTSSDAMLGDINTRIADIKQQVAPNVSASPTYDHRSGGAGLDRLTTLSVPLEASFSPGGVGRMTLVATPTYLSAGTLGTDVGTRQQFGTSLFAPLFGSGAYPGAQTATGVGLNLGYKTDWLSADIGSSPLGFRITNVLGGIEVAPALSSQLRLRLTGERRAVTDSLIAYAGTQDPITGIVYGGVTRTRVHGQLEFSPGLANFYAGGGYDWLNGKNVQSNSELELGAGGSYPVYRQPNDEVRVGLNLVYFAYQRNQDHFTLGYGGYFSPQDYVAAILPVTWTATRGKLDFSLGASVGLQNFNADAESIYPTEPGLQQLVEELHGASSQIQSSYSSQSKSGFIGGLNGSFEYHLTPQLAVGGTASYQKSADWNEATAMGFARYTFTDSE